MDPALPPIPAKRYFTIGEVGDLCGVKPHVLRYWEQEFSQLRPMKRRGNRRYYQHHEVLMIRRIRELLYEQGFTISGARNKLQELEQLHKEQRKVDSAEGVPVPSVKAVLVDHISGDAVSQPLTVAQIRSELWSIRDILGELDKTVKTSL